MTFDEKNIVAELTDHLVGAMSFAMDADAEVQLSDPELVRKVISTATWKLSGEFAAGELFGTLSCTYSSKDGLANLQQLAIKFGDVDAESIVRCASAKTLLDGITNAYQIFMTRYKAKPKQYVKLLETLDKIDKASSGFACGPAISSLTDEIRSQFGTDIELVDTLPKELVDTRQKEL